MCFVSASNEFSCKTSRMLNICIFDRVKSTQVDIHTKKGGILSMVLLELESVHASLLKKLSSGSNYTILFSWVYPSSVGRIPDY